MVSFEQSHHELFTSTPRMSFSFADGLFWLSVACCALAQLFILRSVGASRHVTSASSTLPRQRGAMEVLWAVLPAVGLIVLLVFTWRAMHANAESAAPSAPSGPATATPQRLGIAR